MFNTPCFINSVDRWHDKDDPISFFTIEKSWVYSRSCMDSTTQWWPKLVDTMTFCGQRWTLRRSMQSFWTSRIGTVLLLSCYISADSEWPCCFLSVFIRARNEHLFVLLDSTFLFHSVFFCVYCCWDVTDRLTTRCKKLPKGLKDWQAFLDLKKRIDDFSESCPLLEMMANKAMKQRHWDRITGLTGKKFEVESDTFALQNIMEANLLKYKEDIEVSVIIHNSVKYLLQENPWWCKFAYICYLQA